MTERAQFSAGIGDTLALEFANTADWHLSPEPAQRLGSWRDLLCWAAEQKLIEIDQIDGLARVAVEIGPVLDLREAIFRVGVAVARGDKPEDSDLNAIIMRASAALPAASWSRGIVSWRYHDESVLPQLLGLIARDAVALFASDRVRKVRLCAGGNCGWLFLDESRGRPRRWCSMSDCGNRAKARRAYSRRKR